MTEIVTINHTERRLAQAQTPREARAVVAIAGKMAALVKEAKGALAEQQRWARLRIEALAKLGAMLDERLTRHRPKSVLAEDTYRLADDGISRNLSSLAQQIAAIPPGIRESFFREIHGKGGETTARAIVLFAKRRQSFAQNQTRIVGGRVADLNDLVDAGQRFGTLYLDPPWDTPARLLGPYLTSSLDEIAALPILELAAEQSLNHLLPIQAEIVGIEVQHIDVAVGGRPGVIVEGVPHGVPDEAGADPAVWQTQRFYSAEDGHHLGLLGDEHNDVICRLNSMSRHDQTSSCRRIAVYRTRERGCYSARGYLTKPIETIGRFLAS